MNDLRVLTLVRTSAMGGIETYVLDFGSYLRQRNVRLTVASEHRPLLAAAMDRGLGAVPLPPFAFADKATQAGQIGGFLKAMNALVKHVRSEKIQLIHVNASSTSALLLGLCLSRRVGLPFVLTFHGSRTLDWPLFRLVAGVVSRFSMATVSVSHAVAASLKEALGEHVQPTVIYGGVPSVPVPMVDREWKRIGFVGRLSEEKGPLQLVRAMPLALKEDPGIRLSIIGEGPEREKILEAVSALGIGHAVTVEGWVDHAALPARLAQLGLLVMPSHSEGMGSVMLEAMLCQTPVLATAVGGIPEAVTDGETGYLIPDPEPSTIAQGILRALGSSAADRVGERARERVLSEFSYDRALANWCGIISRIVPRRGEPAE
ncbi:MAG: glycosyltransferase [Methanomassiliicoccales archaeon]|nr:glycosyltransferase [Methanomassiliicoccales archaeon]